MTSRTRYLFTAGALLAITIVVVSTGMFGALWSRLSLTLEPWQRHLGPAARSSDELRASLIAAEEQVVHLSAENTVLRTRLLDYQEIRGEGGMPPEQAVVVRTRIISRSLREGRRYCEVDAGAVDGVAKGMAVCAGWSLVGVIAGVQEGRSLVQLVSDSESRIPAALSDGEHILAEGVLTGLGKRAQLALNYVEDHPGLSVEPGMHVVTAGSDGRLPPGLVLGKVLAADRSSTADHWHIDVAPLRAGDEAESLLVVKFVTAPKRE